jgi:hypothetical protein
MFLSAPLGSFSSHGVSQNSADWRFNCVLLPPWNERTTCRCGRVAIVNTWEFDESDQAGKRFFKCPDLDLDFVIQ